MLLLYLCVLFAAWFREQQNWTLRPKEEHGSISLMAAQSIGREMTPGTTSGDGLWGTKECCTVMAVGWVFRPVVYYQSSNTGT